MNALGKHCQRLRVQRGLSIDRLSKESDQLSPSVIHRLETGGGSVTISALYRYALALGVPLKQLFDFPFEDRDVSEGADAPEIFSDEDPQIRDKKFKTLLPYYSLKAAAGYFGSGQAVEPLGWVRIQSRFPLDRRMFVAQAAGDSMLPKIRDQQYLVFRAEPEGTRQGKIVLAQYRGPADPETGGSYTVKVYHSAKVAANVTANVAGATHGEGEWRHKQITLSPLNPEYEPIVLNPKDEEDFKIVAEYLFSL